jgi:DNA primase
VSFTPEFLDEIRLRVTLSDNIARRVNLTRKGREFSGLCPFHKEKSPSFTVNDEKGFFHCFGCGAHGDVIGFEMRIDNLGFPEAVERLANAAGLALPTRTPEDQERAKRRTSLFEVVEAASAWFESRLVDAGGARAREYLKQRGVNQATITAFRLGWAPDSRNAIKEALGGQDISEAMMIEAGLLVTPEGGGKPYDRFRGRIIFPITDRGGRVVAFGGRALGDGTPKYLNSPETPLFQKGRLLYGLALARKPAHDAGSVVVTEGYMDVIALHQGGIENAVAPLGTALTEDQMRELWRLAPEPVVCFDGDEAGSRAAFRAAERSLALLEPGRSLRFVTLPSGEDPDSLIAARGAEGVRDVLARARPLADILWEMDVAGRAADTPERRAGVEKRLMDRVGKIADTSVRDHYRRDFKARLWAAFDGGARQRPQARSSGRRPSSMGRGKFAFRPPEPRLTEPLGSGVSGLAERRERLLVTTVLAHPELLAAVGETFAAVEIASSELDKLRRAILDASIEISDLDSETLKRHLSERGFATTIDRLAAPMDWSERRLEDQLGKPGGALAELEAGWRHVLSRHERVITLEAELKAAEAAMGENMTDETFARFKTLKQMVDQVAGEDAELDLTGGNG